MVIIALALSSVLTAFFLFKKRQLQARGGKKFWYHFFDKSLEFLLPFTIIAAFFCLLSVFISGTSDLLTIRYLMWFEWALGQIKSFTAMFKLSALATGVILIALYILGLLPIFSRFNTGRLVPYLKKYKTIVRTIYTIVVIFFSFTFFGVQSEKPAAELRFRIKENEKLYGELRREVEKVVRKEVADKLYFKIYQSFPRDYRTDMRRGDDGPPPNDVPPPPPPGPNDGGGGGDDNDDGDGGGQGPIVYDLFDDTGAGNQNPGPTPSPMPPAPEHASNSRIGRAFESLRRYRGAFLTPFVKLFASDAGRELALQPPKFLTNKVKKYVLAEMLNNHQILEPAIDKLFEMLDKGLESPVKKAADKIASAAVEDPDSVPQAINIEATEIVKNVNVTPTFGYPDRALKARDIIEKRWQNFAATRPGPVNQTPEEVARINEQIHLLTCPSEENRLLAARALARGGARLTEAQVNQIKEVLKLNKWRIRLSPTEEGMFVEVPVKYYAARALEGMRSNYLSSADRVAAAEIIYEVETNPPAKQYTKAEVEERMIA